jgi:hypothetical protein
MKDKDDFEGIICEIGAGKSFENSREAQVYNIACDRAIAIVRNYQEGCGLFQITRRLTMATAEEAGRKAYEEATKEGGE